MVGKIVVGSLRAVKGIMTWAAIAFTLAVIGVIGYGLYKGNEFASRVHVTIDPPHGQLQNQPSVEK